MKKIRFLFSLALAVFLAFACTNENFDEKYKGESPDENLTGWLAYFPLNESLKNALDGSEEFPIKSDYQLFLFGEEAYSDAGIAGSQALLLNGTSNYLAVPIGVHDTLSVVFWIKMSGEDFRLRNANPVWFDYGKGAVKVTVDGVTGSTKMLTTENEGLETETSRQTPGGMWENMSTWGQKAFFYAEILSDSVTYRFRAKHVDSGGNEFDDKSFTVGVSLKDAPLDVNVNDGWLYFGKPFGLEAAPGKYVEGLIDDIYIYNRRLTPEEVEWFALTSLE